MSKYVVDGSDLTSLADAIRSKAGTSEPMTLTDMVSAIGDISTGGGRPFDLMSYMNNTMTVLDDTYGDIEFIGNKSVYSGKGLNFIFGNQSQLSYVNLPACSIINTAYVFSTLSQLETISLPNCKQLLGTSVFANTGISSVYLPAVESLGNGHFASCSNLKAIDMPMLKRTAGGNFMSCYALSSISLPNCEVIGPNDFNGCSGLSGEISLPNCKTISMSAFYNTLYTSLYAPNCTLIGSSGIYVGNATFPDVTINWSCDIHYNAIRRVESIGNYTYYAKANDIRSYILTSIQFSGTYASVTLSDTCKIIAMSLNFNQRTTTCSIMNLSNVEYIGAYAFTGYGGQRVSCIKQMIGSHVLAMGVEAFRKSGTNGFSSISYIEFNALTSIPNGAFYSQSSINTIITSSLMYIGRDAFYSCDSLTNVNIDSNISYIEQSAFYRCYSLVINNGNKTIFHNLPSVPSYTFTMCKSLTYINMPSVSTIELQAFSQCSLISFMRFSNLTGISNGAFMFCGKLSKFEMLQSSTTLCILDQTAFQNMPISQSSYLGYWGSIYTRASMVDAYKSATNWVLYSDRIVGMYSFGIGDATYWATMGSTYSQWADDTFDNEDGYVVSDASLFTSDGTKYVVGMDLTSTIVDGTTFQLSNI